MHMADALISPTVGGTMWAASAATIAFCSARLRKNFDDRKIPLMGVAGAFVFAAQMINISIPATGSSGHLGGGLLLAILLGPHAAFLTIASVLVVQALFFADGGLLALGCNIFNLGIFPAFIAYPLVYRPIARLHPTPARITGASIIAGIVGLQMGAFSVVLETTSSGISSLPFSTFAALMQPIHLGIGLFEGMATAAVVSLVHRARPEILQEHAGAADSAFSIRTVVLTLLTAALLIGGIVSWFASEHPDGLEWSIARLTGKEELVTSQQGIRGTLSDLQKKTALLPQYSFKQPEQRPQTQDPERLALSGPKQDLEKKRESSTGTSVSGIVGGILALLVSLITGLLLRRRR